MSNTIIAMQITQMFIAKNKLRNNFLFLSSLTLIKSKMKLIGVATVILKTKKAIGKTMSLVANKNQDVIIPNINVANKLLLNINVLS